MEEAGEPVRNLENFRPSANFNQESNSPKGMVYATGTRDDTVDNSRGHR